MNSVVVLLVDDSASVRERLRVALESEGHVVVEAADGPEGLRLGREHKPAFAVVELALAGMNGFEVAWALKQLDPPPVVFTVSDARSDSDYWSTAGMAGAERGFRKPVNVKELLDAIRYEVEYKGLICDVVAGKISGERYEREMRRLGAIEKRLNKNPFMRQWVHSSLMYQRLSEKTARRSRK